MHKGGGKTPGQPGKKGGYAGPAPREGGGAGSGASSGERAVPSYAEIASGRALLAQLANKFCAPAKAPGGECIASSGEVPPVHGDDDALAPGTDEWDEKSLEEMQQVHKDTEKLLGTDHPATVALGKEISQRKAAKAAGKPLQVKVFQQARLVKQLEAKELKACQRVASAQLAASKALAELDEAEQHHQSMRDKVEQAKACQVDLASSVAGGPWKMLGIDLPREVGPDTQQLLKQFHEVVNQLRESHKPLGAGPQYHSMAGTGEGEEDASEDDNEFDSQAGDQHMEDAQLQAELSQMAKPVDASQASGSGHRDRTRSPARTEGSSAGQTEAAKRARGQAKEEVAASHLGLG